MIKQMAKSQKDNAYDCPSDFHSAMRQRQCTAHHADTKCADKGGQEQAMRAEALAQCHNAQEDGEAQPNFMNHGVQ